MKNKAATTDTDSHQAGEEERAKMMTNKRLRRSAQGGIEASSRTTSKEEEDVGRTRMKKMAKISAAEDGHHHNEKSPEFLLMKNRQSFSAPSTTTNPPPQQQTQEQQQTTTTRTKTEPKEEDTADANVNVKDNKIMVSSKKEEDNNDDATHGSSTSVVVDGDDSVGFIIKCKNNERVIVSPIEAKTIQERNDFFCNVFKHGTFKESKSNMLSKPDWTKETADNIVSLIIDGRCDIPCSTSTSDDDSDDGSAAYRSLLQAAKQILILQEGHHHLLQVRHPLTGHNISHEIETVQALSERWIKRKSQFVLETKLLLGNDANQKWRGLFDSGVVVLRDEKQLVVEMVKKGESSTENTFTSDTTADITNSLLLKSSSVVYDYQKSTSSKKFLVGASTPLCVSVYHTCYFLNNCVGLNSRHQNHHHNNNKTILTLGFRGLVGTGDYLKQKLGKRLLVEKKDSFENIHCRGPVQDLRLALGAVEDFIIPPKTCLLFLQSPTSWTLGQLIRASQHCIDNPATLGWRANKEFNGFYAIKTIHDIQIMLSILSDPATEASTSGNLYIKQDVLAENGWVAF